jgi:hypothetical protein
MAKTGHTPEEQLLSLIEEGKDFARLKHKRKKVTFSGIGTIWKFPSFIYKEIKAKLARLKSGTGEANLKPIINVLLMIAIALSGYLIIDFVFGYPDISHIYERPMPVKQAQPHDLAGTGRTFLSYLAMVQRRNVFFPIQMQDMQQVDDEKQKQEIRQTIKELSANLRLAGIALTPDLQAMIENKETNETLFLKKGDIINRLTIQEIFADRVILSYEGETIELL